MKQVVKVLLVTDGDGGFLRWVDQSATDARDLNKSRDFHLGEFLKVLTETAWVGFNVEITKAHRDSDSGVQARTGADVVGFRFNLPFTVNGASRTLADYDMALFFSIPSGDPNPSLQPEADAIAQFMESGGGFFATGDHANLGGSLCGLIPRVRSMRRWWSNGGPAGQPAAPSPIGPNRIDTTRPGPDNIGQFEDQSDEVPQPISPTWYSAGPAVKFGYPAVKRLPHPLLCSPDGVVGYLPDHMHEGMCEVPDNLAARTFMLGGTPVREYPDYTPSNAPAGYVPQPLAPEIAATGRVLSGTTTPAMDSAHFGGTDPANARTFGVIGAWDGHRVSKGRVVVDSTWHHFFDINLTGDRFLEDNSLPSQHQQKLHGFYVPDGSGGRVPCDEYKMIMWYFRNIVYWLIPAHRHRGIWWDTLYEIVRRPRVWEELSEVAHIHTLKLEYYVYYGQLAEQYLSQARGHCASYLVHVYLYKPKIPWWEWIQRFIDVWDPIERVRIRPENWRELTTGALGAGPRPDVAATVGLGAALVAAAKVRQQFGHRADSGKAIEAIQELWPQVLEDAVKQYGKQLELGAQTHRKLTAMVAEQLGRTGHPGEKERASIDSGVA
jgi:hypothetical protein